MDKYEFRVSLDEINDLKKEQRFQEAAQIADTIDWRRVRKADTLCMVSDIYKINKEIIKSRDVMALANERQPDTSKIIYSLCELDIFLYGKNGSQEDLTEALSLLARYQAMNPADPKRLILQYKMYKVTQVTLPEKIGILEQIVNERYNERWALELAQLYHEAGRDAEAARECRDIAAAGGRFSAKAEALLSELDAGAAAEDVNKEAPASKAAEKTQEPEADKEVQTGSDEDKTDISEVAAVTADDMPDINIDSTPDAKVNAPEKAAEKAGEHEDISVEHYSEHDEVGKLVENVADGMKDLFSRDPEAANSAPEAEKEDPSVSGFAAQTQNKPVVEIDNTMSVGQVMDEWDRIRKDIRSRNDQKRSNQLMQDTGPLFQNFDETAKHGLLEEIEKDAARARRQIRSGAAEVRTDYNDRRGYDRRFVNDDRRYNDAYNDGYNDRYSGRDQVNDGYSYDRYDNGSEQYNDRYGDDEPYDLKEENYDEDVQDVRNDSPVAKSFPGAYEEKQTFTEEADESAQEINEELPEEDELSTRRWDSEAVRKAMEFQSEKVKDAQAVVDGVSAAMSTRAEIEEQARKETQELLRKKAEEKAKAEAEERLRFEAAARARYEAEDRLRREAKEKEERKRAEEKAKAEEEARLEAERIEKIRREVEEKVRAEYEARRKAEEAKEQEKAAEVPEEKEPEEASREVSAEVYEEPASNEVIEEAEAAEAVMEEPAEDDYETSEAEEENGSDEISEEIAEEDAEEPEEERAQNVRSGSGSKEDKASEKTSSVGTRSGSDHNISLSDKAGSNDPSEEAVRIFGPFIRMPDNYRQTVEAFDKISLASYTGNVIITGNASTATKVAEGLLEFTRQGDSNFTGKIAKATGEAVNKLSPEKLGGILSKIENGGLIIGHAAAMTEQAVNNLYNELERKERGVVVILMDAKKPMDAFVEEFKDKLGSFTARIDSKALNDKALVAYGKDYAVSMDYSIDEFGELALAARISAMQTPAHRVSVNEVRDIVDEAISYASKKTPKTLMAVITRKRYDSEDRIIIHEKDFSHY